MEEPMRPCDCKTYQEIMALDERGIGFNNYKISIADGRGVLIEIDPYVRIRLPRSKMKAFAEWYLEYQNPGSSNAIC